MNKFSVIHVIYAQTVREPPITTVGWLSSSHPPYIHPTSSYIDPRQKNINAEKTLHSQSFMIKHSECQDALYAQKRLSCL